MTIITNKLTSLTGAELSIRYSDTPLPDMPIEATVEITDTDGNTVSFSATRTDAQLLSGYFAAIEASFGTQRFGEVIRQAAQRGNTH